MFLSLGCRCNGRHRTWFAIWNQVRAVFAVFGGRAVEAASELLRIAFVLGRYLTFAKLAAC